MPPRETLTPTIAETFRDRIWKVDLDTTNPIVVIETRAVNEHKTYFSAFNYVTGDCLYKEITVPDSWHWSLDRVHNGILLLHSYVHEGSPEHKGIIAIDSSGKTIWQHYHLALQELTNAGLLVYNPKIQPKMFQLLSAETGEILATTPSSQHPIYTEVQQPRFSEIPARLRDKLSSKIIEPVFHRSLSDTDIIAYHLTSAELFSLELAVYQNDEQILADRLETDIQKLAPEAFFMQDRQMFYIRNNQREFVSYLV